MTRFLSGEELLVLHALVVDQTGGSHGLRDVGLLQSIVMKPQVSFGGKELYPDLFKKTAILVEAIVNYHVFVDGNKRTGLVACGRFLFINSYELRATQKEAEKMILSLATKETDLVAFERWLKKNSKKLLKKGK